MVRFKFNTLRVVTLLGLIGSTFGCSLPSESEGAPGEPPAKIREKLALSGDYYVHAAGTNSVYMTNSSTSVCFLTGFGGFYQNEDDFARIYKVPLANNWFLTVSNQDGASPSDPRWASARCITGLSASQITATKTWSTGDPAVNLGSVSDRACFLTGLRGEFGAMTAWIRTYPMASNWVLEGTPEARVEVTGWAQCVTGVSTSERYGPWMLYPSGGSVFGGYSWVDTDRPISGPNSSNDHFCALTHIQGDFFWEEHDWYWTSWDEAWPVWYLEGKSSSPNSQAGIRCVDKNAF